MAATTLLVPLWIIHTGGCRSIIQVDPFQAVTPETGRSDVGIAAPDDRPHGWNRAQRTIGRRCGASHILALGPHRVDRGLAETVERANVCRKGSQITKRRIATRSPNLRKRGIE